MSVPLSDAVNRHAFHPRLLRIGFLPLTDAAPFAAADHLGLFARHGLRVELRREIGWATLRDKITYGELDAIQAPAPMLWSTRLGLGCPPCDVLTGLVLNLHGNALTLSRALRETGVRDAVSLRNHVRQNGGRGRLTFGVGFPFSSQHLHLREWLEAAGLAPDRDVRVVVVPPAQMLRHLVAGALDGYCASEPWNSLAVKEGAGWCPMWSAAHAPGHVEKVLLVTRRFAESRANEHAALIAALSTATAWCDETRNRETLVQLLADPRWLNLPASVIAPALLGRLDCGNDRIETVPDFHIFSRHSANEPTRAKATAIQQSINAAGLLPPSAAHDPDLPGQLFRTDLYRNALCLPPSEHRTVSPESPNLATASM